MPWPAGRQQRLAYADRSIYIWLGWMTLTLIAYDRWHNSTLDKNGLRK
jgi:hypothetical protein